MVKMKRHVESIRFKLRMSLCVSGKLGNPLEMMNVSWKPIDEIELGVPTIVACLYLRYFEIS